MPGIHVASLSAGQDIMTALRAFLADRKWPGALILSAVGSVKDVTFGTPESAAWPTPVITTKVAEPADVVSFIGEIFRKADAPADIPAYVLSTPGDYVIHIHAAIGYGEAKAAAGGFRGGTVMRALNVYIQELDRSPVRKD